MDLIYTDAQRKDLGVLKDYSFDLAFGVDENNFELVVDLSNHPCEPNGLVYIEGTEYGGIIDGIGVVTNDEKLTYKGRTWHGILGSKVIQPDVGTSHYVVSGEVNGVIASLIDRLGLTDLFEASTDDSGLVLTDYQFDRYIDAYSGVSKMLTSVNGKLRFTFEDGKVILSALPLVDYSQSEQFDNDTVEMTIEKTYNPVNHLICLGNGENEKRVVCHLYVDENGAITDKQVFFNLKEVVGVYDSPGTASEDELIEDGTKKLESENTDKIDLNFTSEENTYEIGDIVGAREINTNIVTTAKITKKIVTIDQGVVNIQYKVGE